MSSLQHSSHAYYHLEQRSIPVRKSKDCAFRRQVNEEPSIILSCPGTRVGLMSAVMPVQEVVSSGWCCNGSRVSHDCAEHPHVWRR